MPYQTVAGLHPNLRRVLPEHAQHIYMETFNSAYNEYRDPRERRSTDSRDVVAHKVAWSAVRKAYEKGDDEKWHRK